MTRRSVSLSIAALLWLAGCTQQPSSSTEGVAEIEAEPVTTEITDACADDYERLRAAVADDRRREQNALRDQYRHPAEVLSFFQIEPQHTVVEIWPSGGWWTEILAPYLRNCGQYIAAGFALDANRTPGWRKRIQNDYNTWLSNNPERFDQVRVTSLSIPERPQIAEPGSADRVLTFRNVHNWMNGDYAPAVFDSMYAALKPGGLMGLVEHRAEQGTSLEQMLESGYVTEDKVVQMAVAAGFELIDRSEINANQADTKDHPQGVWSLPPSYRGGEETVEQYQPIGESDRMTLLFRKPE